MPLYEYQCAKQHTHTYLCHIANRDVERICPECKGVAKRIQSPVRTTFKFADEKLKA